MTNYEAFIWLLINIFGGTTGVAIGLAIIGAIHRHEDTRR